MVNEPTMDAERLAALLSRTVDERERATLLARLADADEDYDLFADAAAVLRELDEEDAADGGDGKGGDGSDVPRDVEPGPAAAGVAPPPVADASEAARAEAASDPASPGLSADAAPVDAEAGSAGAPAAGPIAEDREAKVTPLEPRRRVSRGAGARWMALAAVLAGLALSPVLWSRLRTPDLGPERVVALLENPSAGLPRGWTDTRPWGIPRGGGDAPEFEPGAEAKIGALHVDLALAVAARDSTTPEQLVAQIKNELNSIAAGGYLSMPYDTIAARAGEPPEALAGVLREAYDGVREIVLDPVYLELGAWTEAARIAAARRDAAFFRTRESGTALDRAARLPSLDASARDAVARIGAARAEQTPDWPALQTDLDTLLQTLTR